MKRWKNKTLKRQGETCYNGANPQRMKEYIRYEQFPPPEEPDHPPNAGTRPNPPKEQAKAQRPAREIRWNCPVAAKCGGCQLTRLSYAEQLQWKQQRVAELLDGICEVRPILGMDAPFHYRNKVHAVLAVDKAGKPISGVYAMGTHRVVPVRHCLIEDRRADRIIQTIVAMLPAYKLRIYNEYTHRGFLRHILIRTGHVTGQIMVVLVATSLEFPGKRHLCRS